MFRPLEGLRVLDLSTNLAGIRASGVLADYGADVVWVEPIGGAARRDELALDYAVFNRGKRSVELDMSSPSADLELLFASADVLIDTWTPAEAGEKNLHYAALHPRHPALVQCSITGFGSDGPYRDVAARESLVHALIGTMGEQVGHREGPIYEGLPFATIGAGYLGALGVLAALFARARDGVGRHIETSLYDGALVYLAMMWGDTDTGQQNIAHTEDSFMPAGSGRLITGSFRCADDTYIGVHTGAVGAFGRLMKLLGLDSQIPSDVSGLDMGIPLTAQEQEILQGSIHDIFASKPRADWVQAMAEADVCGIPVLNPTEVFDEPQTRHNGMVVTIDDPLFGPIEQVAPPARFFGEREISLSPAPRPGQHTTEVLAEWGQRNDPRPWLGSAPLDNRAPLKGIKVLDLGAMYAGPCASRHMADLGADVIKVEPVLGDPFRGLSSLFRNCQAGKRAIALDLKDPALSATRAQLATWADIVHHNMRPGAAERMGVGYKQIRELNPNVIYGYAAGWGSDGPYARRQSFEPMQSGYVGAQFEVAGQFNDPLYPLGNADPGNGLVGAITMLMSLLHRQRRGQGVYFENPQLNATMTHMAHVVRKGDGTVLGAGKLDPLQYGISALDRLYETADGWLCISVETPAEISALRSTTGCELLAHCTSVQSCQAIDYELGMALTDIFSRESSAFWLGRLDKEGVPAAQPKPLNNRAFMRDPENVRTRRVAVIAHPQEGHIREPDQYFRMSQCTLPLHRLAPRLGEHTAEILTGLGMTAEVIRNLNSRHAVRLDIASEA
ncbi:CaiB/BaiF CoA transferase family protein [Mycobacterium paraintracellulare]|uniref:CaiB/BaiF CoA transferase family protein n=2 Tax=Mycobacterium paraintracellulare TaxID=1138383 RepID=UPI0019275738|nr:CoA transferase [Mycobacterium paraintracellulare]